MTEKSEQVESSSSKRRTRRVIKKQLIICEAAGTGDLDTTDTFRAVAGPCRDVNEAVRVIRDSLPEGDYVLMYEGRRVSKTTKTVSEIEVKP